MELNNAILSTLSYHSKFNYPLTFDELHRFLLINRPVSSNEVKREIIKLLRHREVALATVAISSGLPRLPAGEAGRPDPGSGLLAMTGNEKFFDLRLKRQRSSALKLRLARRSARLIGFLPWVKLVCVTGSLAMENSGPNDDIDLMVVTSPNLLWLTRPFVVLLVSLFFKRRKPTPSSFILHPSSFSNTLCLNLWLDSSALAMPPHRQNLRTAHELAQMKPLINKDKTYEKMLSLNKWGEKFLANFWRPSLRVPTSRRGVAIPSGNFLNSFLFHLQYLYMKPKLTSEEVTLHSAFFHPE